MVNRQPNSSCYVCSKEFYVIPSRKKYDSCCSKNCMGLKKRGRPQSELFTNVYVTPKGNIPWNKGMYGFLGGEKHYNWQGGKTSALKRLRNSSRYKQWRTAVFTRDDYTCQKCGQRGGNLEADHIKQFAHYPLLRFKIDNGRTLCTRCHRATATYGVSKCV